ncbi:MAG: ABC transporter permease subunit [Phycisphaerales bacterium]
MPSVPGPAGATPSSSPGASPDNRFAVARSVKIVDGAMSVLIQAGGIGIIVAVLGIFLFILVQIMPLFRGASVSPVADHPVPPGDYAVLLVDEWSELPGLVRDDGTITFVDLKTDRLVQTIDVAKEIGAAIGVVRLRAATNTLLMGTDDGRVSLVDVNYSSEFADGRRTIEEKTVVGEPLRVAPEDSRVVDVDYGDSGGDKVLAVIVERAGAREVHALLIGQRRTLTGSGKPFVKGNVDITAKLGGVPQRVLASGKGDSVLVVTDRGEVDYFFLAGEEFELRQRFKPFADMPDPRDQRIALAEFIFGDASVAFVNDSGVNRVFSVFSPSVVRDADGTATTAAPAAVTDFSSELPPDPGTRVWGLTKPNFPALAGAPSTWAKSIRTKAFLLTSRRDASLRFSTTESVRWHEQLPFAPRLSTISGKNDRIFFLGDDAILHEYALHDPHPEAGFKAFFGRIWYEGSDAPRFEWQSTGGTDDFEPKLSMVPLLIGTIKGTLYAMLFAVPVALTAALYTSQFAHWKVRTFVKPAMEIMASLPSVVLGFIAALWLAPLVETRVPSVLAILILVPAAALLLGALWPRMPMRMRNRMGLFGELGALSLGLLAAIAASWALGPVLERTFFTVVDPVTHQRVADFRLWWPAFTGADFQQRNALIVGFAMGIAVIPILFTIAEDSLSNVPQNLRSGSLALGATRWQTAIGVVLPTASAGIFSALMVGLGRAVGETMIVLMATGNTPIMNFNIFSGMRTLSANIAVELPEAPEGGTLYRALFLGAMLLFLMTFIVNTLAEVLRQHLRKKYRTA